MSDAIKQRAMDKGDEYPKKDRCSWMSSATQRPTFNIEIIADLTEQY